MHSYVNILLYISQYLIISGGYKVENQLTNSALLCATHDWQSKLDGNRETYTVFFCVFTFRRLLIVCHITD